MRYLVQCTLLLCMTVANAETVTISTAATGTPESQNTSIQQATKSVAQKLITSLGLTTISPSEKASLSLKEVVIKALGEGKTMAEIRIATNQAVSEVTAKKVVETNVAETTVVDPANTAVQADPVQTLVTANPAEVTLDAETGKMMATVLPGESIFRLAQRVYGKENGRKYVEIFAANTDKIRDINVVVQGQLLVMP